MKWWKRQPLLCKFAWVLFTISIIGWPISQFTFARNEPPTVLALSWLAMAFVGVDILINSYHKEQK